MSCSFTPVNNGDICKIFMSFFIFYLFCWKYNISSDFIIVD
ncbi:hypothetical protein CLOSCI_01181 [[Clostridium] scindens ATCC 35704]|nr:hypothetical protein CLOSCI_01181 [[Clostridium] scindens ATCC 35704]